MDRRAKWRRKIIIRIKLSKTCLERGTCGNLLFAGLPAVRQCAPEDPATGQLDTVFLVFFFHLKQLLRLFPRFRVATERLSCNPPGLNFSKLIPLL